MVSFILFPLCKIEIEKPSHQKYNGNKGERQRDYRRGPLPFLSFLCFSFSVFFPSLPTPFPRSAQHVLSYYILVCFLTLLPHLTLLSCSWFPVFIPLSFLPYATSSPPLSYIFVLVFIVFLSLYSTFKTPSH